MDPDLLLKPKDHLETKTAYRNFLYITRVCPPSSMESKLAYQEMITNKDIFLSWPIERPIMPKINHTHPKTGVENIPFSNASSKTKTPFDAFYGVTPELCNLFREPGTISELILNPLSTDQCTSKEISHSNDDVPPKMSIPSINANINDRDNFEMEYRQIRSKDQSNKLPNKTTSVNTRTLSQEEESLLQSNNTIKSTENLSADQESSIAKQADYGFEHLNNVNVEADKAQKIFCPDTLEWKQFHTLNRVTKNSSKRNVKLKTVKVLHKSSTKPRNKHQFKGKTAPENFDSSQIQLVNKPIFKTAPIGEQNVKIDDVGLSQPHLNNKKNADNKNNSELIDDKVELIDGSKDQMGDINKFPNKNVNDAHTNIKDIPNKAKVSYCAICSMYFPSQSQYLEHAVMKHPDNKPFKCDKCECTFGHTQSLLRHKRTIHQNVVEFHICSKCGKMFNRKDDYKQHLRIHRPVEKNLGNNK